MTEEQNAEPVAYAVTDPEFGDYLTWSKAAAESAGHGFQPLYAAPPPAGADAMREALKPFAAVAEYDIGETEADADIYRPMSKNNRAPLLTVGDLRRACAALLPAQQK